MNMRRFHAYMAEADGGTPAGGAAGGDGVSGGGAGDAGGAGGSGGAGASAAGGADSGAPGGTVLGGGAGAGAGAAGAGAAAGPNDWIPEKFRVIKDDKTLDLEASARKVEEHRSHLEKRLGAGDLPPKTAEEYKINVPEAMKATFKAEDLAKDPKFAAFIKDAHAKGMTQAQLDFTVASWIDNVQGMVGTATQFKADACASELKATWGKDGQPASDAEYMSQVQKAFRAAREYGGSDFDSILKDYGNDARIVRLLANVGKDLGEDTNTPNGSQQSSDVDIAQLQASPAYWNPADPAHAATKAKVTEHFTRKFGTAPRSGLTVGSIN